MNQFTYKKYSTSQKESLIEFLEYMWDNLSAAERKKRFEWRYADNPYSKEPFIYIAWHNEKIVGFRAFVFQKFKYNKNEYNVFSPADAIVHPDYRRMGIFSKLNQTFIKDIQNSLPNNSIVLNLSSNKYSTPGYLKQKWKSVNAEKNYAYKFSLFNAFFSKGKPDRSFCKRVLNDTEKIIITNELKSQELSFFNKNKISNKLSNIRDKEYYEWYYAYEKEKYSFIYYYNDNELESYAILKHLKKNEYVLYEYLVKDFRALKKILNVAFKRLSIKVMRTCALSEDDKSILKKSGFVIENSFLKFIARKKRLPILVRSVITSPENKDCIINGIDIRDINNWHIFISDRH